MQLNEIRAIYSLCNDLGIDPREVAEEYNNQTYDFEVDDYRFIREDKIDEIQQDELSSDLYILGSFNDSFISEVTGWPIALIQAAQKGEAYEALGEAIVEDECFEEFQKKYVSYDGYGHHFGHYDGNTIEDLLHMGYYVFRVN